MGELHRAKTGRRVRGGVAVWGAERRKLGVRPGSVPSTTSSWPHRHSTRDRVPRWTLGRGAPGRSRDAASAQVQPRVVWQIRSPRASWGCRLLSHTELRGVSPPVGSRGPRRSDGRRLSQLLSCEDLGTVSASFSSGVCPFPGRACTLLIRGSSLRVMGSRPFRTHGLQTFPGLSPAF